MAVEVLIPKLGMTMTEGTVAEWFVADGAEVHAGDPIYRLETEKIEFQVEAEADGRVRHLVAAGATLEPGAVVAFILAADETMPEGITVLSEPAAAAVAANGGAGTTSPAVAGARLAGGRTAASPIAHRLAKEAGLALDRIAGTGPNGRITEADVAAARLASAPAVPGRAVVASPLARKLAETLGVELSGIAGSGPGGRITKEDVEAAVAGAAAPAEAPHALAPAHPSPSAGEVIPMRAMRKVIAERMHASLQEMAQLTMGMDVVMDDAVKLRSQLVEEWAPDGIRPSYTDLVIKAAAKALRRHPLLNAKVTEAGIELETGVHVGMAVALDRGLVVPVVRDADTTPLKQIAAESTRLAEAARLGKLGLDDMAGQTFSVTALGTAGVDFFTPIINPPNVAILGIGRIRDALAWEGDHPRKQQVMTLSLTIDHRAVDGAPGAAFLGEVRALLEAPYRLLV